MLHYPAKMLHFVFLSTGETVAGQGFQAVTNCSLKYLINNKKIYIEPRSKITGLFSVDNLHFAPIRSAHGGKYAPRLFTAKTSK